jgi:hypothetical protein
MSAPSQINRTPEEIIQENSYLDSAGYLYRAVSWLDYFQRIDHFPALLYACIEGRFGIEYLLFEELVMGTGAKLSREEYEKCLKEGTKLKKAIDRLVPDYKKLQQFTAAIISIEPGLPKLIFWEPAELMKSWGTLSKYLHWFGASIETTEIASWRAAACTEVSQVLDQIWQKMSSGQSGIMQPENMNAEVREVWLDFKIGKIDLDGAKIRLDLMKPVLRAKDQRSGNALQ